MWAVSFKILASPFSSWASLEKFLYFTKPQHFHLQHSISLNGLFWALNELMECFSTFISLSSTHQVL